MTQDPAETLTVLEEADGPTTGGFVQIEDANNPGESDYFFSELYGFSFQPSSLRLLGEELLEERSTIRVAGDLWFPNDASFSDFAAELESHLTETLGQSGDVPPEVRASLAEIPNRYSGTVELWVDPASFLVYRMENVFEGWRDERLVSSERRLSNFSLFNEATLPGPLPE